MANATESSPIIPSTPTEYAIKRKSQSDPSLQVRAADLEPYIGLRYLSRLFKLMAIVLILLLVSEVITGLVTSGLEAIPTLLGEVSRLIVFAGLLWGSGDLAILLIDMGHDLRATRILTGRQLAHHVAEHHHHVDPILAPPPVNVPTHVEKL
jgi:hypothetical protein